MKKKLLLIALPALMVLSSCANVQKEQPKVEPEQPAIQFEEDTVAHEEIFGEAVEAKQPAIRKMDVVDTEEDYKIGYQLHYEAGTDKLSIRFIAAIKDNYQSMVWTRGLANGDGSETIALSNKKRIDGTTPLASDVVYSNLSNGGADPMIANSGVYAGYTGFIVYSLTNIPYTDNLDSYLAAYLTLDPNTSVADDEIVTPVCAVKIERDSEDLSKSAYAFKFPVSTNNYFLSGKIGGSMVNCRLGDANPGANFAKYENLALAEGDYFGSFLFDGSSFKYFGYDTYFNYSRGYFNEASDNSGFATPYYPGTYNLYLSHDDGRYWHVFTSVVSMPTSTVTLYLKVTDEIWDYDGATFSVYAFGGTAGAEWLPMEAVPGKSGLYQLANFDITTHATYILCRMDPNTSEGENWHDDTKHAVWSQTGNLPVSRFTAGTTEYTNDLKGPGVVCRISSNASYQETFDKTMWDYQL